MAAFKFAVFHNFNCNFRKVQLSFGTKKRKRSVVQFQMHNAHVIGGDENYDFERVLPLQNITSGRVITRMSGDNSWHPSP